MAFDGEEMCWNSGSNQRIYTCPLEFLELCGKAMPEPKGVAWKVKKIHDFEVLNRNMGAVGI